MVNLDRNIGKLLDAVERRLQPGGIDAGVLAGAHVSFSIAKTLGATSSDGPMSDASLGLPRAAFVGILERASPTEMAS